MDCPCWTTIAEARELVEYIPCLFAAGSGHLVPTRATVGATQGGAMKRAGVAVSVMTVFWFAWSSFYPNTQVVE